MRRQSGGYKERTSPVAGIKPGTPAIQSSGPQSQTTAWPPAVKKTGAKITTQSQWAAACGPERGIGALFMRIASIALISAIFAASIPASMSIRCDVDGRLETIGGPSDGPTSNNLLLCPHHHNICNYHVIFAKNGHAMCPIDGWVKP